MSLEFVIVALPLLLAAVIFQFIPSLTRKGIFFSAIVDPELPLSRDGRRLLRLYRWMVALWTLSAVLLALVFSRSHPTFGRVGSWLLLLIGQGFSYWRNFREIHTRFGVRKREIRAAGLSVSTVKERFNFRAIFLPLAVLAVAAMYLHRHWNELPPRFPVHWGVDGQPNGWANRNWRGVYGPLLFGGYLDAVLVGLAWILSRECRRNIMRYITVRGLLFLAYPLTFTFVLISLLPLWRIPTWLAPSVLLVSIAGLLGWSYSKISTPFGEDEVPEPQRDTYWKAGLFYWNPHDPAIFVADRVGIGYTINFANKLSWVVLIAVVMAILVPVVLVRPS